MNQILAPTGHRHRRGGRQRQHPAVMDRGHAGQVHLTAIAAAAGPGAADRRIPVEHPRPAAAVHDPPLGELLLQRRHDRAAQQQVMVMPVLVAAAVDIGGQRLGRAVG